MRPLLAALLLFAATPAAAHETKVGALTIDHPVVRASIGQVPNTAAYMTLRNAGATPDRLLSARCACARRVETHVMATEGGVMRMRPAGPLTIPANGRTALEPGGAHLMLIGLTKPLASGAVVELALTFERAGVVKTPFRVTAQVERAADAHAGHSR